MSVYVDIYICACVYVCTYVPMHVCRYAYVCKRTGRNERTYVGMYVDMPCMQEGV